VIAERAGLVRVIEVDELPVGGGGRPPSGKKSASRSSDALTHSGAGRPSPVVGKVADKAGLFAAR
jgi:hypothetical protein